MGWVVFEIFPAINTIDELIKSTNVELELIVAFCLLITVAELSQPPAEDSDALYEVGEGISTTDDDKSMDSLDSRERSATEELESLTKPITPEDIDGIILTGNIITMMMMMVLMSL